MMETKIKNAFKKVEFSKDFEENTTQKINDTISARKTGQKLLTNIPHLHAGYAIKAAIVFGAVILIGTGAYAARKNLFYNIWGSKANIIEPYFHSKKYSRETEHYIFTVENIFLSDNSAQYIMHVEAKTEECGQELDISELKKPLEDRNPAFSFTEHSCTGLEFKNGGKTSGGSGYISILTDISENGSWYILNAAQKEDTVSYNGVKISAWAKWKDNTEQTEFNIPAENLQESLPVPAACTQLKIKQCFANSSGINAEADSTDSTEIESFLENGIIFKVNMKDGSTKTYGGGLVYNNENLITFSCLFEEPVKCENIKDVEIMAK